MSLDPDVSYEGLTYIPTPFGTLKHKENMTTTYIKHVCIGPRMVLTESPRHGADALFVTCEFSTV